MSYWKEFRRREDAFRRREDGLRRKDLELQESLIKFNKFLQENEAKRNRAVKRFNEEKKIRESKETEIKTLEAQKKQVSFTLDACLFVLLSCSILS